jgi:hypothetical protein
MHKHHIIPKHMGGTDEPSNLVLLTVEDHAEAHRKLFEQYGKKQDELAWKGLLGLIDKEDMSRELASLNGKKWLGKKHSESTKQKMSKVHLGNAYCKGIPKSEKHKNNIAKAKLKTWRIITPEGKSCTVDNLVEYCKVNNLTHSKMTSVKKYGYLHKGFYCEKVV